MPGRDLQALLALNCIILLSVCVSGNYHKSHYGNREWTTAIGQPQFERTPTNITAFIGETVNLPCRIKNLADQVVSWIRKKDLHIISSSDFMFTADARFKVDHPPTDPTSWSLLLRNAREEDSGDYECQVNTDPKMKQAVRLKIKEWKPEELSLGDDSAIYDYRGSAVILGPKERHIKAGSRLVLTCHSSSNELLTQPNGLQRPSRLVEWLQDNKLILFDHSHSGVSVDTEKVGKDVSSHLTLSSVSLADGGKYTCKPYNAEPYSVSLFVVEGEHPEAIQIFSSANGLNTNTSLQPIILVLSLSYLLH